MSLAASVRPGSRRTIVPLTKAANALGARLSVELQMAPDTNA